MAAPVPWVLRFHLGDEPVRGAGRFEVHRGQTRLARLLADVMRLPAAGTDVPVRVTVRRAGGDEHWVRTFGVRELASRQTRRGLVTVERVGPVELRLLITVDGERVRLVQEGAGLRLGRWRIGVPARLAPRVRASAHANGPGAFFVRVDVTAPVAGPLLSYWGTLYEEA